MEQAVKDYILANIGALKVPGIARVLNIEYKSVEDFLVDWCIERIYEGDSFHQIAERLGYTQGRISQWMDRDEETANRSARAMAASAEAWLDKGLAAVKDAIDDPAYQGTGKDSGASRAYAQECARRAAIRNPRYRERTGVELTGDKAKPITVIAATVDAATAAALYKELLG